MNSLKDMVQRGKKVHFVFARKGYLMYQTDCGFEFPVPFDDMGDATMLASDKAIYFMRYIRKHMKQVEEGNQN